MTSLETIPHVAVFGSLAEDASLLETIAYQANGLIVVFLALGSIWLLLELIGAFFKRAEARARKPVASPEAGCSAIEASQPVNGQTGPDAATIAAISAAVFFVAGRAGRIVSVTPVDADWAREGRRQIFSSHNVR